MSEFIELFKNDKKELLSRLVPPLIFSAVSFFVLSICKRIVSNTTINTIFAVVGILQFVLIAFMVYVFIKYSTEERAKRAAELKERFDRSHPRG